MALRARKLFVAFKERPPGHKSQHSLFDDIELHVNIYQE